MTSLRWPTEVDSKARRERIATAAMQAVIAVAPAMPNETIARQAVGLADALIAELEKAGEP